MDCLESSPGVVTAQDATPKHKSRRVRESQSQVTLTQILGIPENLKSLLPNVDSHITYYSPVDDHQLILSALRENIIKRQLQIVRMFE
ncbi:hypothetical protein J6590_087098 [Homalodisca vitripennis]|nr:hypothetical protein J6590_087098 [Homalodisca vitripennis]